MPEIKETTAESETERSSRVSAKEDKKPTLMNTLGKFKCQRYVVEKIFVLSLLNIKTEMCAKLKTNNL